MGPQEPFQIYRGGGKIQKKCNYGKQHNIVVPFLGNRSLFRKLSALFFNFKSTVPKSFMYFELATKS